MMSDFPFQLLIKRDSSKNKEESLTCTALLRAIPGRRRVYDALWNNRAVIVKVFSHKINAGRHLKREWRGLSKLARRGLSSPVPLFYGKTKDGQWATVVEKIADSSTVLEVLGETADTARKLDLLILVCRELAKQHSKGVLQKDLHLGNFLLGGDKVFALDPAQMRFSSDKPGKRKSISQLALLSMSLPDSDKESIARLCQEYARIRNWQLGKSDIALLQKQRTVHRKKGVKKGLKKCLRTSKRYLRIKVRIQKSVPGTPYGEVSSRKFIGVFDRNFCSGAEPLDFIKRIDTMMNAGQILKNGRTSHVSCTTWNDKDIVVKRYNHKGFIHSLRHTIKASRARRSWLHGHLLGMLQIPTPKPLAYIERHRGPLVWKSYLITEYVGGQKLYDFLRDGSTEEERSKVTKQVKELLERLGKHRITHGDLKHSNILITDNGPVLTDLDAMKVNTWNLMYNFRKTKDIERFTKHIPCKTSW